MNSGLHFHIDAKDGASRRFGVTINVDGPFSENILEFRFPRWVPGSYFIREPIQHLTDLSAKIDGSDATVKRVEVDGVRIQGVRNAKSVEVSYRLLATEMTCRANHFDASHLHMMPPYTWMIPSRGIDKTRLDFRHKVTLDKPKKWTTATQLPGKEGEWYAEGRDELLDGIMESNANEMFSFEVDGCKQYLKIWDSGGFENSLSRTDEFLTSMEKVVREHYALFGTPDWKEYYTILHLTESGRGGLEHLRSQTSMMPRKALQEGNEDDWRDLISLFSHEFLHQWNVKRLRPKNFLDYDLQKEVHSDLLWWFEGLTSWLGDVICLRSGAWSEEDYRKDWTRKLKRHLQRNGMAHESLQESSNDAWIHLYCPNSYSREVHISYYLEGELAVFCLDVELRKRSKGKFGLDDVLVNLYNKHHIGTKSPGISHSDIKREIVNLEGGRRLGSFLDKLVGERNSMVIEEAVKTIGMKMMPDKEYKGGWLGLNLSVSHGVVKVSTHHSTSPCRELIHTGDEIIAIDNLRIKSGPDLNSAVYGKIGKNVEVVICREGVLKTVNVIPAENPNYKVKLEGKGNKIWKSVSSTRQ